MNIMNKVNWTTVGKVAGYALTAAGGIVTAVISTKEAKKTTVETTEKLFKEYVENK